MSRCIAVASGKGGVGKSVVTANLAAVLAMNGSRVIIVDADIGLRSQDVLLSMENRVVYDLVDLSVGSCQPEQAILASEEIPSLYLLPASQFSRAKSLDPRRFRKILDYLRLHYDVILIDCPAGIERGLRNVLNTGLDEMLLIVTPDDVSIRSAERAVQVMETKQNIRPRLIVNRLDPMFVRSGEMLSAATVAQILDLELLGVIPEDPVVYRSILKHRLFIRYDCEARNALIRIAMRFQGKQIPLRTFTEPCRRLFRRSVPKALKEVTAIDDH
jgi:septum site-determining protein MinD